MLPNETLLAKVDFEKRKRVSKWVEVDVNFCGILLDLTKIYGLFQDSLYYCRCVVILPYALASPMTRLMET